VILAITFAAWFLIRRRQLPQATNAEVVSEALGAWHEAVCPVCLALGAAERLQIKGNLLIEGHNHGRI
jgi:hypothetical protein